MAEQLRFQKVFGDGSTVDRDKRLVATQGVAVQGAHQKFLSRSGFAGYKNRAVRGSDFEQNTEYLAQRRALPDNSFMRVFHFPLPWRNPRLNPPGRFRPHVRSGLFRVGFNAPFVFPATKKPLLINAASSVREPILSGSFRFPFTVLLKHFGFRSRRNADDRIERRSCGCASVPIFYNSVN